MDIVDYFRIVLLSLGMLMLSIGIAIGTNGNPFIGKIGVLLGACFIIIFIILVS